MSKITHNTRLVFSDDSDRDKIMAVLESHRLAWNEASKIKFVISNNSIVELHAKFYQKFRIEQPHIPSQVVIRGEQECLSAYRTVKSNKHKIDKPIEKRSLSMRLDKRIFSYKNEIFSVVSLEKRVKCRPYIYPKLRDLLDKYKFCDPLIFYRDGDIWISLTFDVPEYATKQTLAMGVDIGCRINAATSEGNLYVDRKFNKEKRALRYLKRKLQSKGTKSAKRHLKKIRRKEANKNKNFSHHLANKIIQDTKADTIVVENLKGIKTKKNKFQKKNRVSQVPLYQLKMILTYKAALRGKTVIEVNPAFTSQIDSRTGEKDGIRNGRRYVCKDGVVLDSDCNASVNIAHRSKLPVSCGNILDGQVVVNQPIVG